LKSSLGSRVLDVQRTSAIIKTFALELAHVERALPLRIRLACEKLGATFIKAAQILSSTYGVVPEHYVAEFRNCLDRVPPMPMPLVREVIERSYGRPPTEIFESIEDTPLASASVAQVHRARLTTGESVVAKIKRPDITAMVERDLAIGFALARLVQPRSEWASTVNILGVVEEFERTIHEELDFRREAAFMARYREYVAEIDDAHVFVPRVYEALSNQDVLILDEVQGVPLTRQELVREQFDTFELLSRLMRVWLEIMIRHGVYHGDLHAGNVLFVKPNRVALVDFGIWGELDFKRRRAMLDMLVFSMLGDDRLIARHFKSMGVVPENADDDRLRVAVRGVIAQCIGKPLDQQRFEDLFTGLINLSRDFGGSVPRDIMLMTRQQIYLASHARALAPGKDIVHHPVMLELLFPRPKRQYVPAPVEHPRYRLPQPDDTPSLRALPCPICGIVIESDANFEEASDVYCYACFTELAVVASANDAILRTAQVPPGIELRPR
jgi:ubiquinone biosynthesis protein